MKKISFLCLAMTALLSSCDPPRHDWVWWVKNGTEQTILLKYYNCELYNPAYSTGFISPGDSIRIYGVSFEEKKRLYFNYLFEKSAASGGEDVYWQILSEDYAVLKTWNYSDKGQPHQRFFEEASWNHSKMPGRSAFVITEYLWTFEILPNDISTD